MNNTSERWAEAFQGTAADLERRDTFLSIDECWLTLLPVQSSLKAEQPVKLWCFWTPCLRRSVHKQIHAAAMQCCECPWPALQDLSFFCVGEV